MIHYFLENQPKEIIERAKTGKLSGPEFVGQGCTKSVGSDSYGYYVAEIPRPGRLAALVSADEKFVRSWTDGDMACAIPADTLVRNAVKTLNGRVCPDYDYIMKYGGKWYWCDIVDGEIKRRRGAHACLSWNGCFSYRDPSF